MSNITVNAVKKENSRDFEIEPLDIEKETYGTLPKSRDTKQAASETAVNTEEIEATDVQTALVEVLTKAKDADKKATNTQTIVTELATEVAEVREIAESNEGGGTTIESLPAEKVTFESSNFTSQNVKAALDELFTLSDSNRKNLIAAIGAPLAESSTFAESVDVIDKSKELIAANLVKKGAIANNAMSYAELANLILTLSEDNGMVGVMKFTDAIDATANSSTIIGITPYVKPSDSILQVYRYEPESPSAVYYKNEFDNTNSKSFNYDADKVQFGSIMTVRDNYTYAFNAISDYYETKEIDFSEFVEFGGDAVYSDSSITLKGIKANEITVTAKGDIPLDDLITINGITLAASGTVRVAVSVDKGGSWHTYKDGSFTPIDIYDTATFANDGMTSSVIGAITGEEWMNFKGDSIFMRFAYYIYRDNYATVSGTDAITMNANILARWIPAASSAITAAFDPILQEYNIKFLTAGKYKVAYKDSE